MKDVIKAAKNKMADRVETIWTREIFWNVGHDRRLIVYLLGMIALGVLFYGLYRRYLLWRKVNSVKEPFSREGLYKSMWFLLLDGLFQRRVLRERYAGVMHASILWGFIVLFLGTLAIAVQEDLSLPILGIYFLKGRFYLYLKLVLNIAGLLVLLGVSMAMVRRYLLKPDRLGRSYEDGIILIWIVVVVITGFVLEGLRIYGLKNNWEVWSIGGWVTSQIINRLSPEEISILSVHKTVWWIHLLTAFGFIAYVSFSKLLHVVTSPTNIFIRATGPQGVLSPITNFEGSRSFGVSQIADFSRKQIFDFDACTQCGRCQDNCPAYLSEKPLSPKKVIEELKEEWLERGKLLGKQKESRNEKELLEEDVIWACTFCMTSEGIWC
jgi:nitrate reductase gamma subunit